jgi:hypothetical protein
VNPNESLDASFEEIKDNALEESQSVKISQQMERLSDNTKVIRSSKEKPITSKLPVQPKDTSSLEISIEQQQITNND